MIDFDELILNAQPSPHLSKAWLSYSPFGFGDTFLPDVRKIVASSMYVYDGAGIFFDMVKTPKSVLQLYDHDLSVRFYCFTYPAAVPASRFKANVVPDRLDCCMFVELSKDGQVAFSYKFGEYIFRFLRKQKGSHDKIIELEERTWKMTLDEFRSFFLIP